MVEFCWLQQFINNLTVRREEGTRSHVHNVVGVGGSSDGGRQGGEVGRGVHLVGGPWLGLHRRAWIDINNKKLGQCFKYGPDKQYRALLRQCNTGGGRRGRREVAETPSWRESEGIDSCTGFSATLRGECPGCELSGRRATALKRAGVRYRQRHVPQRPL